MRSVLKDIQYGIRSLIKNPGFTLSVALILALGMGPNTVIFTILDAVIFHPGPYKDADQLLVLREVDKANGYLGDVSYPNFEEWRKTSRSFSQMAAYRTDYFNLKDADSVERVMSTSVSLDFFAALGIDPILGRTLGPQDFRADGSTPVVLSHAYWQKRFAGRPNICGAEVVVDGQPGTVVGVMPRNFRSFSLMGRGAAMWAPLAGRPEIKDRTKRYVEVVGRPKAGTPLPQIRREMELITSQLAAQYPDPDGARSIRVETLRQLWMGTVGPGPRVLALLVLAILLVACANTANLLLAKGVIRRKEIVLRRALGAGRWRLVRQLMTESVLLGLIGAGAALIFSYWGLYLINSFSGEMFLSLGIERFELDMVSLKFSLVLGVLTGLVFGVIPALKTSNVSLNQALKEGGSVAAPAARKSKLAGALVVSELVVATLLLACVSLYVATYTNIIKRLDEPGFRTANIVTGTLGVSEQRFPTSPQRIAFFNEVLQRIGDVPGVVSASLVNGIPGGYSPPRAKLTVGVADESIPPEKLPGVWADYRVVSTDYFRTLEIPLLRGRFFNDFDRKNAPRVAIINQKAALQAWPKEDPLGATLSVNGVPHTVVGIAGNIETALRSSDRQPLEVLVPFRQECPTTMNLVIHSKRPAEALIPDIRAAVEPVGPNEALTRMQTIEEYFDGVMYGNRFLIGLMGAFGLLGALIAGAGVYGIMSHFVSQKMPEIGIRMALGAGQHRVVREVMREGSILVGLGVGIGLVLSALLARFLPTVMFGAVGVSPLVYTSVAAILAILAIFACYLPAKRASRMDPLKALRYE